jgi:starvation-inducible DNA-binding protein
MVNSKSEKILTMEAKLALEQKQVPIVKILKSFLTEERLLYTKLRIYYWNVTGVHFYALHKIFEAQFNDIASIRDAVVEHIRQQGYSALGTIDEFQGKARLTDAVNDSPRAETIVTILLNDHETIIRCLSDDIDNLNEESSDLPLLDLLRGFLKQHEKMACTLRMYFYLEEKNARTK